MSEFVKILLIILLSSVKFVAGPPFAYFDERYDFSFFETVLYCVIGGMLGVWVFTFFSLEIQIMWDWIKHRFYRIVTPKPIFSKPEPTDETIEVSYTYVAGNAVPKRKIFSPRTRKFVRMWKKYGLIGVAFLTPVLISIPIGTIIANSFENNKAKIFLYMFFSIVFWSLAFTSIFELLGVVNIPQLKEKLVG